MTRAASLPPGRLRRGVAFCDRKEPEIILVVCRISNRAIARGLGPNRPSRTRGKVVRDDHAN